jgi:hypothetical protein
VELSPEGDWIVRCGTGPERRGEDLPRTIHAACALDDVASISNDRAAWDAWITEQSARIEAEADR